MLNDRVDDLLLRLPNGCSQFLIHAKGIFYNLFTGILLVLFTIPHEFSQVYSA